MKKIYFVVIIAIAIVVVIGHRVITTFGLDNASTQGNNDDIVDENGNVKPITDFNIPSSEPIATPNAEFNFKTFTPREDTQSNEEIDVIDDKEGPNVNEENIDTTDNLNDEWNNNISDIDDVEIEEGSNEGESDMSLEESERLREKFERKNRKHKK